MTLSSAGNGCGVVSAAKCCQEDAKNTVNSAAYQNTRVVFATALPSEWSAIFRIETTAVSNCGQNLRWSKY